MNIEKLELGISAGLQDRVIQTYGGLVHMDFTPSHNVLEPYKSLDPALLPHMYLAYNAHAGGESGAVHNTVKERWNSQEQELVEGMQELGSYADQAVICLQEGRIADLAILAERNFAMRLKLYGAGVVGQKNLEIIKLASDLGFGAKFTGSGGAILCVRKDGGGL